VSHAAIGLLTGAIRSRLMLWLLYHASDASLMTDHIELQEDIFLACKQHTRFQILFFAINSFFCAMAVALVTFLLVRSHKKVSLLIFWAMWTLVIVLLRSS
jgi:hypothetical protein